jgi:hypothetical protein
VCGRELRNIFDDATNQPGDGTTFETHGHYGSTAFDPMDGTYLEINVCDPCLTAARERGVVLHGMDRKVVVCEGVGVGWTKALRPLLPWTGDEPEQDYQRPGENVLEVDLDDVGNHTLYPEIEWHHGAVIWAQDERKARAGEDEGE